MFFLNNFKFLQSKTINAYLLQIILLAIVTRSLNVKESKSYFLLDEGNKINTDY